MSMGVKNEYSEDDFINIIIFPIEDRTKILSNYSGQFTILKQGHLNRGKCNRKYYLIEFVETGTRYWARSDAVNKGGVKDSANYFNLSTVKDITFQKFGRLIAYSFSHLHVQTCGKRSSANWKCRCDCGSLITTRSNSLLSGCTQSCGCIGKEKTKWINYKHGQYKSLTYRAFLGARSRCLNKESKDYPSYGGRGIRMCNRWLDDESGYLNFIDDMGERPDGKYSLGRIDNDGDYSPENCRWEDDEEQVNNRRRNSNNVSGKTGVSWCKRTNKWIAQATKGSKIKGTYKVTRLGSFATFEEAVAMREASELELYGRIKP